MPRGPSVQPGWGWEMPFTREEPVVVDHPVLRVEEESSEYSGVEQHLALPLLLANSWSLSLLKGEDLGRHDTKAKPVKLYFSEQSG